MKKTISLSIIGVCILSAILLYTRTTAPAPHTLPTPTTTSSTTIIAFGDSLTAGYGLPLSESYPSQLAALLTQEGYTLTVINAGVSGETTAGSKSRAQFIRAQHPTIVLLGIGGNDALRALPVEQATQNIRDTLTVLTSGEDPPRVLLLEIQAPLNAGFAYKASFDQMYQTLAHEFAIPLIPFVVRDLILNPAYVQQDGIHYNKAGYARIIEEYIAPAVRDALGTPTP
jgi:acyl-CoA thioesterase I